MKFLVDTNVWLEVLLGQAKAAEAAAFLAAIPRSQLALTDFTLHSIALLAERRGLDTAFSLWVADVCQPPEVPQLSVAASELPNVLRTARRLKLDFDDAYQYWVAEKLQMTVVSFDAHFDLTPRGRRTPGQAMPPPTPPGVNAPTPSPSP